MILLTGATGFIGSHTWTELLEADYEVIGIDNFSNSNRNILDRLELIVKQKIKFKEIDICNYSLLNSFFKQHEIKGIMHFSALKAVGESVKDPLSYYSNNVGGLINLLDIAKKNNCKNIVFSSSATVYGDPDQVPISESAPLKPTNPYGRTKLISEQILRDLEIADPLIRTVFLRYFNPIGAHPSGLIGEDPKGIPNNICPILAQVAMGRLPELEVFGNDWPTHDGTGVRDYIHVVDLAKAHVKAVDYLLSGKPSITLNLGTGKGYSVMDLKDAFEKVSGKCIPYKIKERRPGDIATCYANPKLAENCLSWIAEYDIYKMCEDSWRWQIKNPKGYDN